MQISLDNKNKSSARQKSKNLKYKKKENSELPFGTTTETKKQPKQKEKKQTDKKDVSSLVSATLQEDEQNRYDNRDRNYQKGKKPQKFQFKAEDFPEL